MFFPRSMRKYLGREAGGPLVESVGPGCPAGLAVRSLRGKHGSWVCAAPGDPSLALNDFSFPVLGHLNPSYSTHVCLALT